MEQSASVDLPPELWSIVISFLAEQSPPGATPFSNNDTDINQWLLRCTQSIKNACLVSRFFHQIANPHRFAKMSFAITLIDGRPEYKLPRLQKFITLLENQPQTLAWIKALYFGRLATASCQWRDEADRKKRDEEYSALKPRLLAFLLQMINLSYLWLSGVSLDLSILSFVVRSGSLETLEISAAVQPDPPNAALIPSLCKGGAERST
ncbi:hypothetical protein FRB90_005830, partial [Tulasnella sp. 427]